MAADNEQFVFQPVQRDMLDDIKTKNKDTVELFEKWCVELMHRRHVYIQCTGE